MSVKAMVTLFTPHTQPDEIGVLRSCNTGSFSRRRKLPHDPLDQGCTSSWIDRQITSAFADGRQMTKFSDRDFDSCVTNEPSRSRQVRKGEVISERAITTFVHVV